MTRFALDDQPYALEQQRLDHAFSRIDTLRSQVTLLEGRVGELEGRPDLRTVAQMQEQIALLTFLVRILMEGNKSDRDA